MQALAIAYRGNQFLSGEGTMKAPELMEPSAPFRNVQELTFWRESGLPIINGCLSTGTKSYFLRLQKEDVDIFRLALDLCRRGEVCVQPSGWGIVATSDQGTELWQPTWTGVLVRYDHPSAYRVAYRSAKHSPWAVRRPEDVGQATLRLRRQIQETLQICIQLQLAPVFDQIRSAWSMDGAGNQLAVDILGLEPDEKVRHLTQLAIECMLLLEGKAWGQALESQENDQLSCATDRLWSATMRAFETIAACAQATRETYLSA